MEILRQRLKIRSMTIKEGKRTWGGQISGGNNKRGTTRVIIDAKVKKRSKGRDEIAVHSHRKMNLY